MIFQTRPITDGSLNPFGTSPNFNADSVLYETERDGESRLYYFDFKANADLFEMTHGPLSVAVGAEYQTVTRLSRMNSYQRLEVNPESSTHCVTPSTQGPSPRPARAIRSAASPS